MHICGLVFTAFCMVVLATVRAVLVSLPCLFFVELVQQIRPSRAGTKTSVFLTSIGDFEQEEISL